MLYVCITQADSGNTAPVEVKTEPADDDDEPWDAVDESSAAAAAAWSILREDFMIGARMKDWDKQTGNCDSVDNAEAVQTDSDVMDDDDDTDDDYSW